MKIYCAKVQSNEKRHLKGEWTIFTLIYIANDKLTTFSQYDDIILNLQNYKTCNFCLFVFHTCNFCYEDFIQIHVMAHYLNVFDIKREK